METKILERDLPAVSVAGPGGYKPSFGDPNSPRRRNLTIDSFRRPVNISAETAADIEQIRAKYRQSIAEPGSRVLIGKGDQTTARELFSFRRKHQSVDMDMTEPGLRALTAQDRVKQQVSRLRTVFNTIDTKNDGKVDPEELENQLLRLGYAPQPGEARDMIWEVDDDGNGAIKWRQFRKLYSRVREDNDGREPRRLYNVIEFMVFDIDNDGSIDLTEVMQLFYQRYGKVRRVLQFACHGDHQYCLCIFLCAHSACVRACVRACVPRVRALCLSLVTY